MHFKTITGGMLVQEADIHQINLDQLTCPTRAQPDTDVLKDLHFAWQVAKSVKSNAIVFAKAGQTLGIGAGQMSRIDSTKIAARKALEARLDLQGAVMASDAFFPFPDNVQMAAELGIKAIIQPGGSMRDEQVIQAADELGLMMVMTGIRHFWH
jgi:phosphoribosylaminoimidazolecarboxamide formyltransferase/IMP cyclohydrolase